MKSLNRVVFVLMMLPGIASAFSLDSIRSIECADRYARPDVKVFFTTSDAPAHQYTRRPGTIPYNYANSKSPHHGEQSGQMILNNNPDAQQGVIALIDTWDSHNVITLVLKPVGRPGFYVGMLSGDLQFEQGWQRVTHYPLNCIIK